MRRIIAVFSLILLAAFSRLIAVSVDDILIADFEGEDFGPWTVSGVAFGTGPDRSGDESFPEVKGFEGKGVASSYFGGQRAEGAVTSLPFVVERRYINFLLGGGKVSEIWVGLLVDGMLVKSALPVNHKRLEWISWDVLAFAGQKARIQSCNPF